MSNVNDPAAVGVIETDAFCEGCGFNLHSQKVWRDDRLGIAVCRCPECGQHSAAGMRTTSGNAWLRRAALAGLIAWLLIQVAFVVAVFMGLIATHVAASEGLIKADHMTRDGRVVTFRPTGVNNTFEFALAEDQPFTVPASEVIYGKRLAPWITGKPATPEDEYRFAPPIATLFFALFFGVCGLFAATVLASMAWFWRRGMKWLWLALPILAGTAVIAAQRSNPNSGRSWTGAVSGGPAVEEQVAVVVMVLNLIVAAIGLAIGRRVARLAVSVFVPPKSRQLFAFLWHCDGLPMPATRAPA